MVDDVVAKSLEVWFWVVQKNPCVEFFPKKWFWGCLSIDLKGLDRYCFRDFLWNGTSFDNPPKTGLILCQKSPPQT